MSATVMVTGYCCSLLLDPLGTEHFCYVLHPSYIYSSSIALSPALAGLFSFCSAAIQTILWVAQWRTSGLSSWLLSRWLTKIQVSGIGSCSWASGHHYKTRYCMIIDVFLQKSDVVKKQKKNNTICSLKY